ncbi:MAG TPA: alcohol dehydrogenase catalytic domain-containing protein [Egibacteraceae bacterium]|nr:alcohol dehydrogenase catalytic domain-containing protein [Egibacteraceae bacterium]
MRAARLHAARDIRVADEPDPVAGPGLDLVRVTAVGVCGSDLHWFDEAGIGDATVDRPLILGHEFAGVIEGGPRHGQRVAIDPAMPCERCETCRGGHRNLCPDVVFAGHGRQDGGLRELLAWPAALLHPLPDSFSDSDGALLEPLGVAIHAEGLGHLKLGASVAVIGCGPIGLLILQAALCAGAERVVAADPLAHRREAAGRLGADEVINPDVEGRAALAELSGGGVDVAFEAAGTDGAVALAMVAAKPGARVVLAGIPAEDRTSFPASLARRKGLTIAVARRMGDVYPRAIGMVAQRRIDLASLVTHRFPLTEVAQAFEVAGAREGLKVVIHPSGSGASMPPRPAD